MVMQDVNLQLFSDSVQGEAFLSMRRPGERKHEWTDVEKAIVIEKLKRLGLYELKDRHPMSLSGGQKQRVAILDAVAEDLSAAALTRGLGADTKRTCITKVGMHIIDYILLAVVVFLVINTKMKGTI